jgi:hypothetical protein
MTELRSQVAVGEVRLESAITEKLAIETELQRANDLLVEAETRGELAQDANEAYQQVKFMERISAELQSK